MEYSCYKCGLAVEEGIPFCPHCSAPQIRVVIAEPVLQPAPAEVAVAAHESAATPLPASQTVPVLAVPMSWSQAVKPCALAALVAALLMSLGLNLFVSMLSGGFLAVVFCRQRQRGAVVKAASGARLGALSGLFSFGITTLLIALACTFSNFRAQFREQLLENAQKFAASHPAYPEFQAAFEQLKTPEGFREALIAGSILFFVFSILLASLGGALGGAILRRRDKP